MQSKEKNNILFIRLFTDEDLHLKIKEACKLHNVKTAVLLSGIGQLKKFRLGYFKNKNNYVIEKFDKSYELLSLTGNICLCNKEYELHLHAILSNEEKMVIGGHFFEGKVEVTNEIVLLKTSIDVKRMFEEKTGLKGLFLY